MDAGADCRVACVSPFRVVPPHTGGRAVIEGACRAWARRVPGFVCAALTTWRDARTPAPAPEFEYVELPSAWSLLISLERFGLTKVPYLWSYRYRVPKLACWLRDREPDVVEMNLPWLYALKDHLPSSTRVVLCMQNVEAIWYEDLLGGSRLFLERLRRIEAAAVARADHILTLTEQDRREIHRRYGRALDAITVSPPGMDAMPEGAVHGRGAEDRVRAVFVGSAFSDNVRAARYLIRELAPRCAGFADFILVGDVCGAVRDEVAPANVLRTGRVDDLRGLLKTCDVFVNPNAMRTGINIKVMDAWAAGLRVITTPEGARGYENLAGIAMDVVPLDKMDSWIRKGRRLRAGEVEHLRPYLWDEIIRKRLALYRRLREPCECSG